MRKKEPVRRGRSVVLGVEQMEERISPAVLENYTGPYLSGYGAPMPPQMPGVHQSQAFYNTLAGNNYAVTLDPIVGSVAPSDNWKTTVNAAMANNDGWTFTYPNAAPTGLQITVKTYEAYGDGWVHPSGPGVQNPGQSPGTVGGRIDAVIAGYTPGANENVRWIQVLTTVTSQ